MNLPPWLLPLLGILRRPARAALRSLAVLGLGGFLGLLWAWPHLEHMAQVAADSPRAAVTGRLAGSDTSPQGAVRAASNNCALPSGICQAAAFEGGTLSLTGVAALDGGASIRGANLLGQKITNGAPGTASTDFATLAQVTGGSAALTSLCPFTVALPDAGALLVESCTGQLSFGQSTGLQYGRMQRLALTDGGGLWDFNTVAAGAATTIRFDLPLLVTDDLKTTGALTVAGAGSRLTCLTTIQQVDGGTLTVFGCGGGLRTNGPDGTTFGEIDTLTGPDGGLYWAFAPQAVKFTQLGSTSVETFIPGPLHAGQLITADGGIDMGLGVGTPAVGAAKIVHLKSGTALLEAVEWGQVHESIGGSALSTNANRIGAVYHAPLSCASDVESMSATVQLAGTGAGTYDVEVFKRGFGGGVVCAHTFNCTDASGGAVTECLTASLADPPTGATYDLRYTATGCDSDPNVYIYMQVTH